MVSKEVAGYSGPDEPKPNMEDMSKSIEEGDQKDQDVRGKHRHHHGHSGQFHCAVRPAARCPMSRLHSRLPPTTSTADVRNFACETSRQTLSRGSDVVIHHLPMLKSICQEAPNKLPCRCNATCHAETLLTHVQMPELKGTLRCEIKRPVVRFTLKSSGSHEHSQRQWPPNFRLAVFGELSEEFLSEICNLGLRFLALFSDVTGFSFCVKRGFPRFAWGENAPKANQVIFCSPCTLIRILSALVPLPSPPPAAPRVSSRPGSTSGPTTCSAST